MKRIIIVITTLLALGSSHMWASQTALEPFAVECDGDSITVNPADETAKYYIIVTSESNNTTLYKIHAWKENWGYEEACDEWTWEFKVREWAEDEDVFTGKHVFAHSDLGGAMGLDKGQYNYIVAHCTGAGPEAERTSDFKKGTYYYNPGFRMEFASEITMSDPPVDILHFRPEEDQTQTYYYVLLSEAEVQAIRTEAGKELTYEQIWERKLRENVHSADELMSGEHTVDRINQEPGHYHLLIRGAYYQDGELMPRGKLYYREFEVFSTKENDFNITPHIGASVRPSERYIGIRATNTGEEDYFIFAFYTQQWLNEKGYTAADWLEYVGKQNLYGFTSSEDYFVGSYAPNLVAYGRQKWATIYGFDLDMTENGHYGLVLAYTTSDGRTINKSTVKTYEFDIYNTPTDIDVETANPALTQKELRNGMLIIRRENKVYNVLGQIQ